MRITIESTNKHARGNHKSVIEYEYDDMDLYDVLDNMVKPLLIGFGFHPQSFDDVIETMAENIKFDKQPDNEN